MDQPKFIEKNKKVDPAMDFMFLRTEGIRRLQELTGAFWTDYNLHDPGVTILEQLCYAITDLAYRTNSDIEEHLFTKDKTHLPFFKPEETLTNNPITIEDFRKVLIDSIPKIKNIWIEPMSIFESGFNGLYRVLVDISDYGRNRNENVEQIKEEIVSVFSNNRNLSEDIFDIDILEELPVKIHAKIETDGVSELEKILSKIYFEIEQLIAPEVKFYSLKELIKKGLNYEQIFNGPKLKHGFIQSEDLIPQQSSIIISDIVRSIMKIEGVVSVKQLYIEVDGKRFTSQMIIPKGKIPRIVTSGLLSGENKAIGTIQFYKGSLEYTGVNHRNFVRYLNELISENKKAFRISESSIEIPSEAGQMNFSEYYSIQNHFPAVYGVGEEGIPGKPDLKRRAKAKQLKAYLLIFEQFMANYLSQLHHFNDLLSIHKKQSQTYFTQPLEEVPRVDELLANKNEGIDDAYLELADVPRNYNEGIKMLNNMFDNYSDRRNRFLDFLLATHGETLSQYTLHQFNYYYNEEEFEEFLIRCKTAFLQHLGEMNYSRATGFDYKNSSQIKLSGFEKRISIFLGFGIVEKEDGKLEIINSPDANKKSVEGLSIVGESKHDSYEKKLLKEGDISKYEINNQFIENKFDLIDDIDLKEIPENVKKSQQNRTSMLPFKLKKVNIEFLTSGIDLSNYRIGKVTKPENLFLLVFKYPKEDKWLVLGEFKKYNEALVAVETLIGELIGLNINSENVKMVEHVLLRPSPNEEMYGIYINDKDGQHVLKSNKQFSLKKRTELLSEIEKYFGNEEAFYVDSDENRDMNIIFELKELDLKFKSINPRISVEETHEQKEKLFEFLSGRLGATSSSKFGFYIQYGKGRVDIPEEFYSFQLSLLFPNWTTRFQNQEFRAIARDIILEQKPANIHAYVNWLAPDEMEHFEILLRHWKDICQNMSQDSERQKVTSELAEFLYERVK